MQFKKIGKKKTKTLICSVRKELELIRVYFLSFSHEIKKKIVYINHSSLLNLNCQILSKLTRFAGQKKLQKEIRFSSNIEFYFNIYFF